MLLFFFFWLCCVWNPAHPALEVWSLNHWTTREVSCCCFYGSFKNTFAFYCNFLKKDLVTEKSDWEGCMICLRKLAEFFPRSKNAPLPPLSPLCSLPSPVSSVLSSSISFSSTSSFLPFVLPPLSFSPSRSHFSFIKDPKEPDRVEMFRSPQ